MRVQVHLIVIGLVILGAGAWPNGATAQNATDVIESFEIDGNGGLLIVPVTIDGKEYPFVVDTGSTTAVFDTPLQGALVPTGKKVAVNGGDSVELCNCPNATVGQSKFGIGAFAVCADLSDLRRRSGYNISGFIGMGFLEDKLVQLDFDAGRMSILRQGTTVDGQRIPVKVDSQNLPFIEVDLPVVGLSRFLVDTGCCGFRSGFLSKVTFGELCRGKQLEPFAGLTNRVGILDSQTTTRAGLLAWQSVGGSRHNALVYTIDNSNKSSNALGLGYLCRYKLTLDFHNWELILEKGKWFDRACPANQAGIDIDIAEGNRVVTWVDIDGPAWEAGVRPGDRILLIDGRKAKKLRLDQIGDELYWVRGGVTLRVVHAMESDAHDVRLMQDSTHLLPVRSQTPADP